MISKFNIHINEEFAKTKILCTLGPATSTKEKIKELLAAGMDGVRLNFSHGDYKFYDELFINIHKACVEESTPLGILLDLQGPKIRVGDLKEEKFEVHPGEKIEITTEKILGTKEKISTSYSLLAKDAEIGNFILIDDGLIKLKIISKTETSVFCEVINGGIIKPRKGMNLPGMKLSTPSITEKDLADIEYASTKRVDYLALSFVRSAKDIIELRSWLHKKNINIPIIAKIEKKEAVDDFDNILNVSDGIMIARGDLGVELDPQDVPIIQKYITKQCNAFGKLVITATQMLESMIQNPIPTRAEASDVANAVWDGTDIVMLSGETSVGKFPIRTVEIMNNIVRKAEQHYLHRKIEYVIPDEKEENLFDSVCKAVVQIADQTNVSAILVYTYEGRTAIRISKFRPKAKIIAVSESFETMNKLCLRWGITSLFLKGISKEKVLIEEAKKLLLENKLVNKGDMILYTAGAPYSDKSRANWIKFEEI